MEKKTMMKLNQNIHMYEEAVFCLLEMITYRPAKIDNIPIK